MKFFKFENESENWYEWLHEEDGEKVRVGLNIPTGIDKEDVASVHFVSKGKHLTYSDDSAIIEDKDLMKLRNDIDTYLISKGY